MVHFKLLAFASCLAMVAIGPSMASSFDDCRNGNAFVDPDKQFAACDGAMQAASEVKQKAFLRFKRAEALYWMNQFGPALDDVNLAIDADPQLIPAYIRRAWIYIIFRQWEDANRDIVEVLAREPRNAEALFALSYVYTSTEPNSERAFEALRQAVEIDPNFHLARLDLAYKNYYRGDLEAMLKEFGTILAHDEAELDKVAFRSTYGNREAYPFSAYVRYQRGMFLMFAHRDDEALADFNWLISRYPKIALAFVFRGQVLRDKNNDIDALKDYSRAVELDPQNADARRGKGWTLLGMKKFDEAIVDADWMAGPGSPIRGEGYQLRAAISKERGDNDQALLDLEEAFRNDPELLSQMQQRLAELGYISAQSGTVYSEEIRNGVRACIADPGC